MNNLLIFLMCIFLSSFANKAFGYEYQKKQYDLHVVHILKLNPSEYQALIVKANDGKRGRETVSSIANRYNASIAINAGFFEIGGDLDGKPSGSLIIEGKPYGIMNHKQSLVIIENNIISLVESKAGKYVNNKNISLVSGSQMLLKNGKIPQELINDKNDFCIGRHARTAVGIDKNKQIIIIVAEHLYKKDITSMTLGELQSFLKDKGTLLASKFNKKDVGDISLSQFKQILKEEFGPKSNETKGLTLIELAKLMLDLGCTKAINLDGGGSCALWINGSLVNNTFGDKDEASGEKVERKVSDAIIFKKNN
ncbi:MAG: phosphodiester glycosidase family protein [Rickettsiaceae bacterium]|nr:phosphodiester glycosidase family protein [Rickettsiaceae bacterium]